MILTIILTIIILMVLHEIAHILIAKLLNMPIDKIGIAIRPIPHIYVSAINENKELKKDLCFLLSGSLCTIIIFLIWFCIGINYSFNEYIYYGFSIQIILELNPFYSDYTKVSHQYNLNKWLKLQLKKQTTITTNLVKEKYCSIMANYTYSKIWYLHFTLWMLAIIILLSPHFFKALI